MKFTTEAIEAAVRRVIGDGSMSDEDREVADLIMDSEFVVQRALNLFSLFVQNPAPESVLTILPLGIRTGIEAERSRAFEEVFAK